MEWLLFYLLSQMETYDVLKYNVQKTKRFLHATDLIIRPFSGTLLHIAGILLHILGNGYL